MPQTPVNLDLAEFTYSNYCLTPDGTGVTLENVLDPDYWRDVSARCKVGDIIEVRSSGAGWYASLMVRGKMVGGGLVVGVIQYADFEEQTADTPAGSASFEVKAGGRAGGWRVVRTDDKEVVYECETKQQANDYLAQLTTARAA